MDIFEKCYLYTKADEYKKIDLYPYFHYLETKQNPTVIMEGKERIMLGSNNYLGLTSNERVIKSGLKALEEYGTGCSGSRFLNGTLDIHLELEKELANFLRKEDVITFSTGFQTNLGIISSIASRRDYLIVDKESHASIYDGCRLSWGIMKRYNHNDIQDLEKVLKSCQGEQHGRLIITDGVFSMGGDIANLPDIVKLAEKYDARIMVDDAHGLGVIGEGGRGTASYFGLEDKIDIYMGTFSKSLASLGGYCAASHKVVDFIRHHSRPFIFSASIPPANCMTALEALKVLKENPGLVKKLDSIASYMRTQLKKRNIKTKESTTPIIPIYTYDEKLTFVISKELYDKGVYVNPVLPPAAENGQCLIRTSYMATLSKDLLDKAIDIIEEVLTKYNLIEKKL